jgi:hypothetical protein
MKLDKVVILKKDEERYSGHLIVEDDSIVLDSGIYKISKQGGFYFFMLRDIRSELQKSNIFLLINGSRKDVYPSGMSLPGMMAYVQIMGKQSSSLNDLVNIFDETTQLDMISTVEEQDKYHNNWINSLGE